LIIYLFYIALRINNFLLEICLTQLQLKSLICAELFLEFRELILFLLIYLFTFFDFDFFFVIIEWVSNDNIILGYLLLHIFILTLKCILN